MEITKTLPFDFCESCPMFVANTECNNLWYGDRVLHSISISCENRHICENLKKYLEGKCLKGGESET